MLKEPTVITVRRFGFHGGEGCRCRRCVGTNRYSRLHQGYAYVGSGVRRQGEPKSAPLHREEVPVLESLHLDVINLGPFEGMDTYRFDGDLDLVSPSLSQIQHFGFFVQNETIRPTWEPPTGVMN